MDVYVYVLSEFEFWRPSTPSQTASAEQKIRHKQVRYRRMLAPIYSVANNLSSGGNTWGEGRRIG